jgi:hypothetical protein
MKMFNDVVYNQFAHLNGPQAEKGPINTHASSEPSLLVEEPCQCFAIQIDKESP